MILAAFFTLFIVVSNSEVDIEPYVEYRIRVRDLNLEKPVALRPDWTYPAPECHIERTGDIFLCEASGLWWISPDRPATRLLSDPLLLSISKEDDGSLTVTGGTNMRRIWSYHGRHGVREEFLLDFNFAANMARVYCDSLLVVSGTIYETQRGKTKQYGMAVYHRNSGDLLRRFLELSAAEERVLKRKNNSMAFNVSFTVAPNGNLIVSKTTDYRLYEYTIDGRLVGVFGEKIPEYYRSIEQVPPLDLSVGIAEESLAPLDIKERMRRISDRWFSTWTAACFPLVFNKDYIIIQRGRVPPYYLEFFDLKTRKLLGHIRTDNRLLYAEPNGSLIYLLREASDTLLRIGGYKVTTSGATNFRWLTLTQRDADFNSQEWNLPADTSTILLYTTPFDCGFPDYFVACSSFVARNPNWKFKVAVYHNNGSVLAQYVRRLGMQIGTPLLADTFYLKTLKRQGIVIITPAIFVFDENAQLRAVTDIARQISPDSFLNSVTTKVVSYDVGLSKVDTLYYFYIIGGGPCEEIKNELSRLTADKPGLKLMLLPISQPENYQKLRSFEEKLTQGISHPLPVLVIGNTIFSGREIIQEVKRRF